MPVYVDLDLDLLSPCVSLSVKVYMRFGACMCVCRKTWRKTCARVLCMCDLCTFKRACMWVIHGDKYVCVRSCISQIIAVIIRPTITMVYLDFAIYSLILVPLFHGNPV